MENNESASKPKRYKIITLQPEKPKAKPKAKPAVTQGKHKGGNNVVKQQATSAGKPQAPRAPRPKKAKRR